jgi:hypothetical protein
LGNYIPIDPDELQTVISEAGKKLEEEKSDLTPEATGERLDRLETLIESMGQASELVVVFNTYIGDLQREVTSVRRIRFVLIFLSVAFIVWINVTLYLLVFKHGLIFELEDTYLKGAVFIGTLTASVVLLSIMLKGAFHSLAERHKEEMLPPHIKEIMDAVKMVLGK